MHHPSFEPVRPSVRPFISLFVCSSVHSFVHSFVVYSVVCSFRHVVHSLWRVEHYIQDLSGCILNLQKVSVYGMWITQVVCVQYFSYPFKMVYLFYSCIFFGQRLHSVSDVSIFFEWRHNILKIRFLRLRIFKVRFQWKSYFKILNRKIWTTFYIKIKFA